MADLVMTPANVVYSDGPVLGDCVAGAVIAAGDMVALDTDNTWKPARCSSTAALAGASNYGMALASAPAIGGRLTVGLDGATINIGSIVTAGIPYFLSTNSGKLCLLADLVSTNKVTLGAMGLSATNIQIQRVYHALAIKP